MAFDRLYIAKRMLLATGETISALTNATKAGRLLNDFYDGFVNEVFHMNINWKFASTRAQLGALATPAFGWDYQYAAPQGLVRIIATVDENDDYINYSYKKEVLLTRSGNKTTETDVFLTDQDNMFARYVYLRTNPKSWPGWFQELVILHGARALVRPIKKDDFTALHIDRMYKEALAAAKGANGAEDMEAGDNFRDVDKGNTDIADAVPESFEVIPWNTQTINRS